MQTAAVQLEAVSKLFGSFAALRNITLTIPAGSCTMLLGENGAGKSTLLRLIAGLAMPTQGTLTVLSGTPQLERRRIAYMSHAPMLYDELSATENLRYFTSLYGLTSCAANPETALRAVALDPHLSRPIGQYSQGMRQRVSLARVLQADPELLLLDEPFSNLDVASTQQMVDLLRNLRTSNEARTIILTTHHARLAAPLADTTLTLHHGAIVSETATEATA